jgi:hypothetical protein
MSIVQYFLTSQNINDIANYVNAYRAKNQAPPLEWDTTLSTFSQNWSYYMARNNLFQHSGSQFYGENVSYLYGYGTDPMKIIYAAIDGCYNEIFLYDFANRLFRSDWSFHMFSLVSKH